MKTTVEILKHLSDAGYRFSQMWTAKEPGRVQPTVACYNVHASDGRLLTSCVIREMPAMGGADSAFIFWMSEGVLIQDDVRYLRRIENGLVASEVRE